MCSQMQNPAYGWKKSLLANNPRKEEGMANIQAVTAYRSPAFLPLEFAARLRTYLKGKQMPARPLGGGLKIRKPFRAMTPSDFFEGLTAKALVGVKPDVESMQWADAIIAKNKKSRAEKRAKAVANRKRKEDYLKSGPKPGKKYPKFLEAMRKLGEKRRREGWNNGKTAKKRGKSSK